MSTRYARRDCNASLVELVHFLLTGDEARSYIKSAFDLSEQRHDNYAMVLSLERLVAVHALSGNWREMFEVEDRVEQLLTHIVKSHYLVTR